MKSLICLDTEKTFSYTFLMSPLSTPIAFFIFNRPDLTAKVFAEIRRARPEKLFIIADGPRADHPEDVQKCIDARRVVDRVDWPCEVLKNYSEINLGCQLGIPSGIDWVFEEHEDAIILEDDCLPDQTFFRFCQELLERYRNDPQIMGISSCNFQYGKKKDPYSYYFSLYNHYSGWATWRRAWKCFDFDMKKWPELRDSSWLKDRMLCRSRLRDIWQDDPRAVRHWGNIFQQTYENRKNSWGYRWTFSCWAKEGLTVLPDRNLVENIGFREDATHTKQGGSRLTLPTHPMDFPLTHPPAIVRDIGADRLTQKYHFATSFFHCLKQKIKNINKLKRDQ